MGCQLNFWVKMFQLVTPACTKGLVHKAGVRILIGAGRTTPTTTQYGSRTRPNEQGRSPCIRSAKSRDTDGKFNLSHSVGVPGTMPAKLPWRGAALCRDDRKARRTEGLKVLDDGAPGAVVDGVALVEQKHLVEL